MYVVCMYMLEVLRTRRIQMVVVVEMAAKVPMGMDFWASFKSPDLLEPAMIPMYRVCIV